MPSRTFTFVSLVLIGLTISILVRLPAV